MVAILLAGCPVSTCWADEIRFMNQKATQTGTVVREDQETVTIRFPRATIKSIRKEEARSSGTAQGKVVWEEGEEYIILKIPRREIEVVPARSLPIEEGKEKTTAGSLPQRTGTEPPSKSLRTVHEAPTGEARAPAKRETVSRQLMEEEMGSVEGTITWQGKPIKGGRVKIVMETYAGSSPAALKEMFLSGKDRSSEKVIDLETETDETGHYAFPDVPPGQYRLYWMVPPQEGWVHRLQEKPDFEVTPGKVSVCDVPKKGK